MFTLHLNKIKMLKWYPTFIIRAQQTITLFLCVPVSVGERWFKQAIKVKKLVFGYVSIYVSTTEFFFKNVCITSIHRHGL